LFRVERVLGFSLPRKLPTLAAFGVEDGAPGVESLRERCAGWFAYEQVDVLGHDDVAEDFEVIE